MIGLIGTAMCRCHLGMDYIMSIAKFWFIDGLILGFCMAMHEFVCWCIVLDMYAVEFVGSLNLLVPT